MSVYYTVREHLVVADNEELYMPASIMRHQLALLGGMTLLEDAYIMKLEMIADGKEYSFSGGVADAGLQEILSVMEQAKTLEITADYEMRWTAGYDYLKIGPFVLGNYMKDLLEESQEYASKIFYSIYNKADNISGVGTLYAYGEKNGKCYSGTVEPVEAELPNDGLWQNDDNVICFELENASEAEIAKLEKLKAELEKLAEDVSLSINPECAELCAGDVKLKYKAETESFITVYKGLWEMHAENLSLIGEFHDFSGSDVRTLILEDADESGVITVKMASI